MQMKNIGYFSKFNEHSENFYSGLKVQKHVGQIFSFAMSFILKEFQLVW